MFASVTYDIYITMTKILWGLIVYDSKMRYVNPWKSSLNIKPFYTTRRRGIENCRKGEAILSWFRIKISMEHKITCMWIGGCHPLYGPQGKWKAFLRRRKSLLEQRLWFDSESNTDEWLSAKLPRRLWDVLNLLKDQLLLTQSQGIDTCRSKTEDDIVRMWIRCGPNSM